jgi:hypothetical protein
VDQPVHNEAVVVQEEGSPVAGVHEAELTALRLRLEAVNLRGLAEAVDALLGEYPAAVCEVFASWDLARSGELPRLVDHCWAALAPLEVGVPSGPAPGRLEKLLAGLCVEPQVILDAVEDCRDRADRVVPVDLTTPPASSTVHSEQWHWALTFALDDFWALMADVYARARPALLRRDRAETVRLLESERSALGKATQRIEALANRVASGDGTQLSPPDPIAGQATYLMPSGGVPRIADPPLTVIHSQRLTSAEEVRRWLPVVFVVAVTGLAVVVLVIVAYGSPPG